MANTHRALSRKHGALTRAIGEVGAEAIRVTEAEAGHTETRALSPQVATEVLSFKLSTKAARAAVARRIRASTSRPLAPSLK